MADLTVSFTKPAITTRYLITTNIESDVETLKSDVSTLQTETATNTNDISTLSSTVSSQGTTLTSLSSQVQTNTSDISSLKTFENGINTTIDNTWLLLNTIKMFLGSKTWTKLASNAPNILSNDSINIKPKIINNILIIKLTKILFPILTWTFLVSFLPWANDKNAAEPSPKHHANATEIIVIALIILLLFGGAKLPSLMKGIGKGVKQFKDATNGKFDDEDEQNKPKNEAQ